MKIPFQLHQFKQETALIIVSGAYDARLFVTKNGIIIQKKLENVLMREDGAEKEGFWRTGRIKVRKDTDSEDNKEHLREKFLHALRNDTFDLFLKEHITDVYLLAPHYISLAIIEHAMHPFLRQRIKIKLDGDYHYHHPTEILKLITREKKELGRDQTEKLHEKLRAMTERNILNSAH